MAITAENAQNNVPNTAFGETVLRVGHAQYTFANDGGAQATITPLNNCTIPANAIIYNCSINPTTAPVGTSATIAVGLSAGGGTTTSLIAATAIASWTLNAKMQGVPVPQTVSTWIKLTAAAQVTITVATTNLSAGVIEVYVFYIASST